jgi:hypothetical protein
MKMDWSRTTGWLVPLLSIASAGYAIFDGNHKLQAANKAYAAAELNENAVSLQRDQAEKESGTMRYAVAPVTQNEETDFLGGLRAMAAGAGVKPTRWNESAVESAALPPGSPAAASSAGTPNSDQSGVDPALQNVQRIKGELTVFGPYQSIRSFLKSLDSSARLYTLSDMHLARKDSGLELTLAVTRYIDPTLPPDSFVTHPADQTPAAGAGTTTSAPAGTATGPNSTPNKASTTSPAPATKQAKP